MGLKVSEEFLKDAQFDTAHGALAWKVAWAEARSVDDRMVRLFIQLEFEDDLKSWGYGEEHRMAIYKWRKTV